MTDFKPGDVGINERGETVFCVERFAGVRSFVDVLGSPAVATGARPLALIDPESAEDMGRLSGIWHATHSADLEDDMSLSVDGWRLRLVLREYANPKPPKPAEPEGLGAVAEDASQRRWVLTEHGDKYPWFCGDAEGDWRNWESIAAVRILSEGVTP